MNQEDNKGKGFQKLKKFLIDKFPELTKLKSKNINNGPRKRWGIREMP
jgi:hypothetical protein